MSLVSIDCEQDHEQSLLRLTAIRAVNVLYNPKDQ